MDGLRSVDRLMRLLELLATSQDPLRLVRISDGTGLDKATARRFALALERLGYVERDTRGRYRLTDRLPQLLEEAGRPRAARAEAEQQLRRLAAETGMSVSVSRLVGGQVEYILREPEGSVHGVVLQEGARLPAHATAIGKVLLAELPPAELRQRFPSERLARETTRTIATRTLLEGALQEIRRQGWALSDGELDPELRAAAVPIRESATAAARWALNASTVQSGVAPERFALETVPMLLRAVPRLAPWLSLAFGEAQADQASSR